MLCFGRSEGWAPGRRGNHPAGRTTGVRRSATAAPHSTWVVGTGGISVGEKNPHGKSLCRIHCCSAAAYYSTNHAQAATSKTEWDWKSIGGFLPGEKKILRFGRSASWPKSPPILVTLYPYLLVNKALFDPQKKKGRGTRGGVVRYQQPAQSTHGSSKA